MTDQERDDDGQAGFFPLFLLFDEQTPDFDHVLQKLEMNIPVIIALMFEQNIHEPWFPLQHDLVQHVGIIG